MILIDLETELLFVEKEKERLLREYPGKYILVKGKRIVGSFDTYANAADEGIRQFGMDSPFLVHFVATEPLVNLVMEAVL